MPNSRIATLRREHDMNQRELGEHLGVAQTTVSAWETGKTEPDSTAMGKMAELFHVSIGYLMGYEPETLTRGLSEADYDALIKRVLAEKDRTEIEKMVADSERDPELEETIAEYFSQQEQEDWKKAGPPDTLEGFLASRLIDAQPSARRKWLCHMLEELVKGPET